MEFEVKDQKILEKIRFKNNVFFDCIFLWILLGFGEDLGRVLGGVWRLWEPLRPFFGVIFSCLYLGWSSIGLLEASGLDFGSILWGLEEILGGLGRVLAGISKDSG